MRRTVESDRPSGQEIIDQLIGVKPRTPAVDHLVRSMVGGDEYSLPAWCYLPDPALMHSPEGDRKGLAECRAAAEREVAERPCVCDRCIEMESIRPRRRRWFRR